MNQEPYRVLLLFVLKAFVMFPKELRVVARDYGMAKKLVVECNPRDISRIIGKGGNTMRAITALMEEIAIHRGETLTIGCNEPAHQDGPHSISREPWNGEATKMVQSLMLLLANNLWPDDNHNVVVNDGEYLRVELHTTVQPVNAITVSHLRTLLRVIGGSRAHKLHLLVK